MIQKMDHFVITAQDPHKTAQFYAHLGFTVKEGLGRYELFAGDFKINVHTLGQELLPHAQNVHTGSADFCLQTDEELSQLLQRLQLLGIESETGIVSRNGVKGAMRSIYLRDPDGNLVELCRYE